jgi:hypothetical protein
MAVMLSELLEGTLRIFSTAPFISESEVEDLITSCNDNDEKFVEAERLFWQLERREDNIRFDLITETLLEAIDKKLTTEVEIYAVGFLSPDKGFREQMEKYRNAVRPLLEAVARSAEDPQPSILARFDFYLHFTYRKYYFPYPILTKSLVSAIEALYNSAESVLSEVSLLLLPFRARE